MTDPVRPRPGTGEPSAWRFDGFVLEPAKRQLTGRRGPVAVEPRVLELLTYLLEQRHRVVSKRQLVEAVWGGRHVTDAAISAGIKKARAALGDDAANPRSIATVYGRGFRFVAPAEPVAAPTARPPSNRRRWRRGSAAAVATALAAALAVAVVSRVPTPRPPRLMIGALAPDPARTGAADELAAGFRRAFRASRLDLVPSTSSAAADPDALARAARAQGADAALALSLAAGATPGAERLTVDLLELAADGVRTVRLADHPLPRDDRAAWNRTVAIAARQARTLAVASLGDALAGDPTRAEARRLALDALGSWRVSCRDRELLGLLAYAVERDPSFAQGWYALALTRASVVFLCTDGRSGLSSALMALRRARRLAPAWSEPLQLEVALLGRLGREQQAMELLLAGLARDPDAYFLRLRAAEVLRYAGQLERSGALLADLERRHPGSLALTDTVPYPDLYRADWSAFLDRTSLRASAYFAYYRGFALWRLDRGREAEAALDLAAAGDPGDVFAGLAEALLAIFAGDPEAAFDRLERLDRRLLAQGPADGEMTYKVGQLLLLAGDRGRAVEVLARAVAEGFACTACLRADPVWSTLTGAPAYERVVARATLRERAFAERWLARLDRALAGHATAG